MPLTDPLTIECDVCRRPIVEVRFTGRGKEIAVTTAAAGSVRDVSPPGNSKHRYRIACTARKHRLEVRTFTTETLRTAYIRYQALARDKGASTLPRIGMRAVTRQR